MSLQDTMWGRSADEIQIVPVLRRARGETVQTRNRRTILVVDDDENDRGFMVSALRSIGVKDSIHVASSGSEDCLTRSWTSSQLISPRTLRSRQLRRLSCKAAPLP